MVHPKNDLRAFVAITALVLLALFGGCSAYVRRGTTVIGDFVSPDGKWDAVLMVRNGGAMASYATQISVVRGGDGLARQVALFRAPNLFVADDNDGAVRWGNRGQIDVRVRWASSAQLVVTYPEKAEVFKQESKFRSVSVTYVPSK